jgi:hypothetical protein
MVPKLSATDVPQSRGSGLAESRGDQGQRSSKVPERGSPLIVLLDIRTLCTGISESSLRDFEKTWIAMLEHT